MTKGEALRDRTAAAIIDSAATILAEHGNAASMDDIATSAGISRATLYRYFRNRDELLTAMGATSVQELAARIEEANLEAVPFDEAIARLARALIATGNKYTALGGDTAQHSAAHPDLDARVTEPIRALFRRASADGSIRDDLSTEVLMDLFSGLIKGALDATSSGQRGVEETAAAVSTLFLHGTHAR
jgi:AcrR family transcriptional regulator